MEKEQTPSLCYRCEQRARHLEAKSRKEHYQPRCECGDIDKSVYSCYMFCPVRPIILEANEKEARSLLLPAMLRGRAHAHSVMDAEMRYIAKGKKVGLFWKPKLEKKKSSKPKD